jgi:uncharacterized protein YyaL (SSP411 family)
MTPSSSCAIRWLPWSADAFARSHAERKPVLLSIVTTWSRGCGEMDRTTYADPAVASAVAEGFIPIRVDADRRPDISSRYTLGGWPTTAFLNSDGDILGGGTFVPADRFPGVLDRVVSAFRQSAPAVRHACDTVEEAPGEALPIETIEARVFELFDAHAGAFGGVPRFPHTAPVHLALARARDGGDSRYAEMAATCLDAMGWGGLYDEVDGGFFRYANGADWTRPQSEKLLEVNAPLLMLYLDAFETLGHARYLERAEDLLGYLQQTMADGHEGGWAASQEEAPEYYAVDDAAARARQAAPAIDRTLLTAPNAVMVSSALRAARVMQDDGLRTFALRSLDRVALRHYRPGHGVAHCIEGDEEIRGLLDDQVAMASAHLDAYEVTEDIVHEMMAEELGRQAVIACGDAEGGGFFDRASSDRDVGLLRRRHKPFVANCEAARMLRRLAAVCGDGALIALADAALAAVAPQAAAQGPLAAHYVLAARDARLR